MFEILGFINENFYKESNNGEFSRWQLRHFYNRVYKKMSDTIEYALKSMENRGLIKINKILVSQKDNNQYLLKEEEKKGCIFIYKSMFQSMGYQKFTTQNVFSFLSKNNCKTDFYNWQDVFYKYEIEYIQPEIYKEYIGQEINLKQELNDRLIQSVNLQAEKQFFKNSIDLKNEETEFCFPVDYIHIQKKLSEHFLRI